MKQSTPRVAPDHESRSAAEPSSSSSTAAAVADLRSNPVAQLKQSLARIRQPSLAGEPVAQLARFKKNGTALEPLDGQTGPPAQPPPGDGDWADGDIWDDQTGVISRAAAAPATAAVASTGGSTASGTAAPPLTPAPTLATPSVATGAGPLPLGGSLSLTASPTGSGGSGVALPGDLSTQLTALSSNPPAVGASRRIRESYGLKLNNLAGNIRRWVEQDSARGPAGQRAMDEVNRLRGLNTPAPGPVLPDSQPSRAAYSLGLASEQLYRNVVPATADFYAETTVPRINTEITSPIGINVGSLEPRGAGLGWWASAAMGLRNTARETHPSGELLRLRVGTGNVPIALRSPDEHHAGGEYIVLGHDAPIAYDMDTNNRGLRTPPDADARHRVSYPAFRDRMRQVHGPAPGAGGHGASLSGSGSGTAGSPATPTVGTGAATASIPSLSSLTSALTSAAPASPTVATTSGPGLTAPASVTTASSPATGSGGSQSVHSGGGAAAGPAVGPLLTDQQIATAMLAMVHNPHVDPPTVAAADLPTLRELLVTWMVAEPARHRSVIFNSVLLLQEIAGGSRTFQAALDDAGDHPMTGAGTAAAGRQAEEREQALLQDPRLGGDPGGRVVPRQSNQLRRLSPDNLSAPLAGVLNQYAGITTPLATVPGIAPPPARPTGAATTGATPASPTAAGTVSTALTAATAGADTALSGSTSSGSDSKHGEAHD
jgi:hypothetical protein